MTSTPINYNRFWTDHHDDHYPIQLARASQTVPHTLYFDLEVRRGPDEYGGDWERVRKEGGVSILCIWDEREGRPYFYDDHTLSEAAERLSAADLVVGFNSAWFDVPLIENHLLRNLPLREHLDLFSLVRSALDREGKSFKGHGLGALASQTIGRGKNGESAHAPKLAGDGRWGELVSYCLEDVLLTRDLGHFIAKEGYVIDREGERLLLSVPPWYISPQTAQAPSSAP
jgi:DEAD/DEAH box helicase domain-containing protein